MKKKSTEKTEKMSERVIGMELLEGVTGGTSNGVFDSIIEKHNEQLEDEPPVFEDGNSNAKRNKGPLNRVVSK